MKKLFKFFILFNAIIPLILASCPDYPTIPTTTPLLITSASEGLSNFPSSFQQLSISMLITPKVVCPSGSKFPLFSMNKSFLLLDNPIPNSIGTNPDSIEVYIDCTNLKTITKGSWFATSPAFFSLFSSTTLGPVGIFLTLDLNTGIMTVQAQSEKVTTSGIAVTGSLSHPYFDDNSKFYFCADKNGASSQACTVSDIVFEYRSYSMSDGLAHLSGTNPDIAAFYPLSDESLATSLGSTTSAAAYFGDKASNPTETTKPTWDSSKNFVTITSGQFLTIPLPDLSSTNPTVSSSFSFAAWIKLTDLPSPSTTLFAMYSADGTTQIGYKLSVTKSSNEIELTFSSGMIAAQSAIPAVTLNQWQLVGFTASVTKTMFFMDGTFFVGTSSSQITVITADPMDLSTAYVIRIGDTADAFSGQILAVRITTPGGGVVRTTDLCSSDNSIELGVGSFALACSGSKPLNTADNQCVDTCPSDSYTTSGTAIPLCISCLKGTYSDGSSCQPCSDHCIECDAGGCITCEADYQLNAGKECVEESSPPVPSPTPITKEKSGSGLSGGAIAGIVCGSLILLLFLLFIILVWRRYSSKKKQVAKEVSKIEFASPKRPISPIASEANPLMP